MILSRKIMPPLARITRTLEQGHILLCVRMLVLLAPIEPWRPIIISPIVSKRSYRSLGAGSTKQIPIPSQLIFWVNTITNIIYNLNEEIVF